MARHASIVPATAEHFTALKGASPPRTCRAYTAVRGEEVLGIFGVCRAGAARVAFAEFTEDLRADKRSVIALLRAAKTLLKPGDFAEADPAISKSEVMLEHIGFEPYEGRMYIWLG